MIKVYPVKIEAVNENESIVFTIATFDEYSATLKMETTTNLDELDELFAAIRQGFELLDLNNESSQ